MKPFFRTKERENRLLEVLESWEGTPFRHRVGVKHFGVDCAHFVGCVLIELGIIESFKVTKYSRDFCLHTREEGFVTHLRSYPILEEININGIINGDVLLYKFGRVSGHSAIYFDGYAWQARSRAGVIKINCILDQKRLTNAFRIMEKE